MLCCLPLSLLDQSVHLSAGRKQMMLLLILYAPPSRHLPRTPLWPHSRFLLASSTLPHLS